MATVIYQGTDQTIRIAPILDANDAPINPAGCTVRAQVRPRADSSTVLYEWSSPTTVAITTGQVELIVSAAVSSAWTWFDGVYDVELTDGAGKVTRIAGGQIQVSPEVTR